MINQFLDDFFLIKFFSFISSLLQPKMRYYRFGFHYDITISDCIQIEIVFFCFLLILFLLKSYAQTFVLSIIIIKIRLFSISPNNNRTFVFVFVFFFTSLHTVIAKFLAYTFERKKCTSFVNHRHHHHHWAKQHERKWKWI